MGRIWDNSPGGQPPRALTPTEIDLLQRTLGGGGKLVLTAEEASQKATMYLLLRGVIFPSLCAGEDVLVYSLTPSGRSICDNLRIGARGHQASRS